MKGRLLVLLMVTVIFSSTAFADTCAQVVKETPSVSKSFKLTILDSKQAPRAGVKVALGTVDRYSAMHPVSSGITDSNGVLNFVNVKPGNLTFQLTDPGGERQWYDVQVLAEGGDATVDYNWPFINWLTVRSATGLLMKGSQPMQHLHVTLEGFPEGNELAYTDTDGQGRFDLPAEKPGRYYVELTQSESQMGTSKSLGRIPITVTLDEHYAALDAIFVEENSCGLTFDQFCSLPKAEIASGCIQTVEANGDVLPGATARLFSQRGSIGATTLNSDKDGNIKLPNLAAGDYQLQIYSRGHTPVRRVLSIATGTASCKTPMVIPMNPFGSGCAPAIPAQGKGN